MQKFYRHTPLFINRQMLEKIYCYIFWFIIAILLFIVVIFSDLFIDKLVRLEKKYIYCHYAP